MASDFAVKITKRWAIVAGVVALLGVVLVLGLGIYSGKNCAPNSDPIETGIDAGPALREIEDAEKAAHDRAVETLRRIEEEREAALEALSEEERAEYERVRSEGPEAVVRWLNDFDRERFR